MLEGRFPPGPGLPLFLSFNYFCITLLPCITLSPYVILANVIMFPAKSTLTCNPPPQQWLLGATSSLSTSSSTLRLTWTIYQGFLNKMRWFHQNTQVHVILSFLWARGEQKTKVANGTPMNAMTGTYDMLLVEEINRSYVQGSLFLPPTYKKKLQPLMSDL